MEVLKRDYVIVLGELMPLSLATFTSVNYLEYSEYELN